MPFDGTETLISDLHGHAPLPLVEFVRHLNRHLPGARLLEADGPGRTGGWWLDLAVAGLTPAVEWREATGFGLYGPGPTLPERPVAQLTYPADAAARLARFVNAWSETRGAEAA